MEENNKKQGGKFSSYDIKMAEWRGEVTEALGNLKAGQTKIFSKIDKINNRITGVQIKVATIGGISGLIVSAVGYIILKKIFG